MQAPDKRATWTKKAGTYYLPGLKRVRHDRELSIRELAARARVGSDTVWKVETLRRGAEPKTRRKLARALGTTLRELRTPDEDADEL